MEFPVKVADAEGHEWVVESPGDYNQMVYGSGYHPVEEQPAKTPVASERPAPASAPAEDVTTA